MPCLVDALCLKMYEDKRLGSYADRDEFCHAYGELLIDTRKVTTIPQRTRDLKVVLQFAELEGRILVVDRDRFGRTLINLSEDEAILQKQLAEDREQEEERKRIERRRRNGRRGHQHNARQLPLPSSI